MFLGMDGQMSDIFSSDKRSEIMKKVKPRDNKTTELQMIKIFDDYKLTGWCRHYNVKGHPDFVFLNSRIAIFVDGCFWHGHDCRNTRPEDNKDFWEKKRKHNILHDQEVTKRFEDRGWTVIRIWECELKKKNRETLEKKLAPLLLPTDQTHMDNSYCHATKNLRRSNMDFTSFCDWLISEKKMSERAARDVVSRTKRVCRMLNDEEIQDDTLERLYLIESYQDSSMFIKSQLKRAVALVCEFREAK